AAAPQREQRSRYRQPACRAGDRRNDRVRRLRRPVLEHLPPPAGPAAAGGHRLLRLASRGDQPDHALRAARAALALQREPAGVAEHHPNWPRMRVGVNSGEAVVREIGGDGHIAYTLVGDTVNTGFRLEGLAPVGGVLIGAETYKQLPDGAVVEARAGLRVKGKGDAVDAYLLLALP